MRCSSPDLDGARELVELTPAEEALLERPAAPDRDRAPASGAAVASGVAPRSRDLGVMLAYSPLHHLLAADAGVPLVLTSGNVSDEPIAYTDDDALAPAGGIADALLVNDRPIHTRTDDSVVRSIDRTIREAPLLIRRSRGYAPAAVALPFPAPRPMLGCGAELKNTFCVAKDDRAWVGPHVGDLKNFETLESYRAGIDHLERLFAVEPAVVAHDLHPDYLATRYALRSARASRRSASSTTMRTWPLALPSTGSPPPPSARSSTAPGYGARRHGLGRRDSGRRPDRIRARGPAVSGAPARWGRGDPRALADGVCLARLPPSIPRRPSCHRACANP